MRRCSPSDSSCAVSVLVGLPLDMLLVVYLLTFRISTRQPERSCNTGQTPRKGPKAACSFAPCDKQLLFQTACAGVRRWCWGLTVGHRFGTAAFGAFSPRHLLVRQRVEVSSPPRNSVSEESGGKRSVPRKAVQEQMTPWVIPNTKYISSAGAGTWCQPCPCCTESLPRVLEDKAGGLGFVCERVQLSGPYLD